MVVTTAVVATMVVLLWPHEPNMALPKPRSRGVVTGYDEVLRAHLDGSSTAWRVTPRPKQDRMTDRIGPAELGLERAWLTAEQRTGLIATR
jgi:hypothetical protein